MEIEKIYTKISPKQFYELKLQVWGQHLGQKRFYHSCDRAPFTLEAIDVTRPERHVKLWGDWSGGTNPNLSCSDWVDFRDTALLVKPISKISVEDAWKVATLKFDSAIIKQLDIERHSKTLTTILLCLSEHGRVWQHRLNLSGDFGDRSITDYLRALGYATRYKNWSVEELVEFGIFKLEE